jgi:hypothetical protein
LAEEDLPEAADLREASLVFTIKFLSAIDIFDVTDNSSLLVGGQLIEKFSVVSD